MRPLEIFPKLTHENKHSGKSVARSAKTIIAVGDESARNPRIACANDKPRSGVTTMQAARIVALLRSAPALVIFRGFLGDSSLTAIIVWPRWGQWLRQFRAVVLMHRPARERLIPRQVSVMRVG